MSRLVVVSNRLPARGKAVATGGLAVAMEAALKDRGGLWLGWSGQTVDAPRPLALSRDGEVTYAALDLTHDEFTGYYEGIANSVLWPLCHYRVDLLNYSRDDIDCYRQVNTRFAEALIGLLRPDDVIWVHDYHLMPLAAELRQRGVENRIGYFHHIPWPAQDLFRTLPGSRRFLADMLAYDLIGLQTPADVANLHDAIDPMRDGTDSTAGTRIAAYPISIDTAGFAARAARARELPRIRDLHQRFGARDQVIGVDRLDYSKGLPDRLRAFEHLLSTRPELHGRLGYMQITPASRGGIDGYERIGQEVAERAGRLNAAYGNLDWTPVRYINRAFSQTLLAGLYRLSRIGLVTPLRDGMNLVAKEYVAAQDSADPGVLILSEFAGAAAELTGALIVNPHDVEEVSDALATALAMPLQERRERHDQMMTVLRANPIEAWARDFLRDLGPSDATPKLQQMA